MPKPFLVLGGSPAAIFFFFSLLTSSLFCAQLVDGKKTVTVVNDIHPNASLTIHCWSSEDDLGEHALHYKQSIHWRFEVNFFETTKFVCDSSWNDPGKGGDQSKKSVHFTAYGAGRDWREHCMNVCVWSIRRDGGYYGDGGAQFPFVKMFSY